MPSAKTRVYMWQNNMCISYTILFKRFEDFLLANGWDLTEEPEQADWILVGACAGFLPQIDEYMSEMKKLLSLKKRIAVFGCLPKVTPEQFIESTPSVDLYIPSTRPQDIEKIMPNPKVRWSTIQDPCGFRKQDYRTYDPGKKFIVVQYGCNAGCVYCPHKIGMGSQISRPREEILELVRASIADGAHTIFLEGMDSGSWGTDLEPPQTYLDILEPILEMPEDFQVHIGQFGANWLLHHGDRLLEAFCHARVTDIKIPIQTASPRLLELMGRDSRVLEIGPFLKTLREDNERLNLRTDLIIGFPTETREELDLTLKFVSEHFDEVACFGFEIHPRTPIAKMDLPFYEPSFIENRVRYALAFLGKNPRIITHRGGQVYETLHEREKRRMELGTGTRNRIGGQT